MTDPETPPTRSPRPKRPDVPAVGRITGFGNVKGDAGSRTIQVDGRKVATLTEVDRTRLGLRLDLEMTPEQASLIAFHHEYRLAWRSVMQRLSKAARTVLDTRQALHRRGHDEAVIDRIIEQLEQDGLLDDQRFASSAAADLARRSPAAAPFIEARLRRHGVPDAEAAQAAVEAAGNPIEAATTVATRALRSLASCTTETKLRRIQGRLARRGFDEDVITEVMQRIGLDPLQ